MFIYMHCSPQAHKIPKLNPNAIERTVCRVAARNTGELLVPGPSCNVTHLAVTLELRRSLFLVIVMSWSKERELSRETMQREIQEEIRKWSPNLADAQVTIAVDDSPGT